MKKKAVRLPSESAMHDALRGMFTSARSYEAFGAIIKMCDPDLEVLNVENFASTAYNCGRRTVGMELKAFFEDIMPGGYEACRSAYADYLERLAAERKLQKEKKEEMKEDESE